MGEKTITSFEPKFFTCQSCGNQIVIVENFPKSEVVCCGQPAQQLTVNHEDVCSESHLPVITFTGGLKASAAQISVGIEPHPMTEEHHIEWVYLQTRKGGQFQYLGVEQKPKVTFALTGQDAYAYCDRQICKMGKGCKFKCKQGFVVYAYCNLHGLWKTQT